MAHAPNTQLDRKALSELRGMQFTIPSLQRGYKWTETHVEKLLLDLKEFIDSGKRMYCLQPLAVTSAGDTQAWRVLDGQQRLTTIFLLHSYLFGSKPYTLSYERDGKPDGKRSDFLERLATCTAEQAEECIDFYFIYKAYQTIKDTFEKGACKGYKEKFSRLLEASTAENSVQMLWYEVDAEKEHDTFSHLNTGKIQLTNTELIKALFLNRVSGMPSHRLSEVAAHFEQMEQTMQNDNFWAMLSTKEPEDGQTRMDLIFNLVAGATEEACRANPRWSFEHYFDSPAREELPRKWEQVRHTFLRLWGMYNDVEMYHYIGFLAYCRRSHNIADLLQMQRTTPRSQFIKALQEKIAKILRTDDLPNVTSYGYDTDKKQLRQLFVMHNIETILANYRTQQEQNGLMQSYERFPFELLRRQKWDIEHIASNTDCTFDNVADREAWLAGTRSEIARIGQLDDTWRELMKRCEDTKADDINSFTKLYKDVITAYEEFTPTEERIEEKDYIGNLTLLDSHTNRSYHNAIFPRKRSCVIEAKTFVPACTRAVFYKTYRKEAGLSMDSWTQSDAKAYVKDMEAKLGKYF